MVLVKSKFHHRRGLEVSEWEWCYMHTIFFNLDALYVCVYHVRVYIYIYMCVCVCACVCVCKMGPVFHCNYDTTGVLLMIQNSDCTKELLV